MVARPSSITLAVRPLYYTLQAADAEWSVSVDYSYDEAANKTVYTFEVDALSSSSSCGSPESLSIR